MPTLAEHRRSYEAFTTQVSDLCTDRATRRALQHGRGRPVNDCLDLHRHLSTLTPRHAARRAYYTVASLIALADPLAPDPPHSTTPPTLHPPNEAIPPPPTATPPTVPQNAERYGGAWYRRPNLGFTLATAVHRADFNEDRTDDLLNVLARLGDDQLHRRLPSLASRLLAAGITPDWPVLLGDLIQRGYDRGQVSTRWLDAFYLTLTAAPKDAP
jgi:CRISPR-associated protein Cse2 (CRISPR_cse2)